MLSRLMMMEEEEEEQGEGEGEGEDCTSDCTNIHCPT